MRPILTFALLALVASMAYSPTRADEAADADAQARARAVLALAAAAPVTTPQTCACTSPADCSCGAGCQCAACYAARKPGGGPPTDAQAGAARQTITDAGPWKGKIIDASVVLLYTPKATYELQMSKEQKTAYQPFLNSDRIALVTGELHNDPLRYLSLIVVTGITEAAASTTSACGCSGRGDCTCDYLSCPCPKCQPVDPPWKSAKPADGLYHVTGVDGRSVAPAAYTLDELKKLHPGQRLIYNGKVIYEPPVNAAPVAPTYYQTPGPSYSSPYSFMPAPMMVGGFGGLMGGGACVGSS